MIKEKEPNSWDIYFIDMAEFVASKSKDNSTKVGAVVVGPDNEILSTGFNGFPRGVEEVLYPERWERPQKYEWVIHAEANAIANAARVGISLKGSRLYVNYKMAPCSDCAALIIQAGIKEILGPRTPFPGVGNGTSYHVGGISEEMFNEAKIKQYMINYDKG